MPDYSSWLRRAEAFVRATSALPGNWSMNVSIAPPLGPEEASRLDRLLPHGLSSFLRDFYVTASADSECRFSWTPDGECLAMMTEILPHEYNVYGGPSFCSAATIIEHHRQIMALAEVFEDFAGYGPAAGQTLRESVPLISVGNGDYVALHMKAIPGQAQVIYVTHDSDLESESPIVALAGSGEEFLSTWERLCYLGPEIWLLFPFIENSSAGRLDSHAPLVSQWRAFMKSLSLPI